MQLLNEILIAPNAVPWIREYLAGVFPDLAVTGKLPVEFFTPTGKISVPSKALGGKPSEGFLVLERTGGGSPTPVTELAAVMIDSWHNDEGGAERQLLLVKSALEQSLNRKVSGSYAVRYETAGGPFRMPEPDYQAARYRMNIIVHLRRVVFPTQNQPSAPPAEPTRREE